MRLLDAFIVAEISKSYVDGAPVSGSAPLAVSFEMVINKNHERGYRLVSFQLHRMMTRADELNETIIAVFERTAAARPEVARESCTTPANDRHAD